MVKAGRKLIGATNPLEAEPGTIRGDLAIQTGRNVVHGSDSPENGTREAGEIMTFITSFPRDTLASILAPVKCLFCRHLESAGLLNLLLLLALTPYIAR